MHWIIKKYKYLMLKNVIIVVGIAIKMSVYTRDKRYKFQVYETGSTGVIKVDNLYIRAILILLTKKSFHHLFLRK